MTLPLHGTHSDGRIYLSTLISFCSLFACVLQELAAGKSPFVMVGAIHEWPALQRWADLHYFAEHPRFAESIVDWYPFNLAKFNRKPWLLPWRRLVQPDGSLSDSRGACGGGRGATQRVREAGSAHAAGAIKREQSRAATLQI